MNLNDAREIIYSLEKKDCLTPEEEFEYTESLLFVFNTTKEIRPIIILGGYYYSHKQFDLALKYYDIGKELGYKLADLFLGYIWYYGRTGDRDYKKAFDCFSSITKCKIGDNPEKGEVTKDDVVEASFKLADMYKNGYYVSKDYEMYKSIINETFDNMKNMYSTHDVFEKYVEVGLRKARLYEEENNIEKALELYYICKRDLCIRLQYNIFFGDINQMEWTINDIYRLLELDTIDFDLYVLFYLLKKEHEVQFVFNNKVYSIESRKDNDGIGIRFEDEWFRSYNELLMNVQIGGYKLPSLYNKLEMWKLVK